MKPFSINQVNAKNDALLKAGKAIIDAKSSLEQLSSLVVDASFGAVPNMEEVVEVSSRLQKCHDDILCGLVESAAAFSKSKNGDEYVF